MNKKIKKETESPYVCINVPPDVKARIKAKAARIEKKLGRTYTMIELIDDFSKTQSDPKND